MKTVPDPVIEIMLSRGETVTLSVRDNGSGIEELDLLFEPFHTTKKTGMELGWAWRFPVGLSKITAGVSRREIQMMGSCVRSTVASF